MESPRTRRGAAAAPHAAKTASFQPIAMIGIEAVAPAQHGFTLTGQGVANS